MIHVSQVSKWYGAHAALRGVSFEAPAGEVVGLLGPNGAGKTTTLRIITGFLAPSAGSVRVCGHDTVDQSLAARRCLGYLPEAAPLYPEMSVRGYLHFRGRLMSLRRGPRRAAVGRALARCDVADVAHRRIGQLSKGYRQRVGIAAALLHDPAVIVLDEPSSGLDPAQIRQMRGLMRELAQTHCVLVSSHVLPEVEQTCDRVVIITRGRVRAEGSPAGLIERVRHAAPYVVEARGEAPERVLRAVPGAARVAAEPAAPDGWQRLRLFAAPGAGDLREAIARTAAAAGLAVRELARPAPGLEQLFLSLLETDDDPGTGPAPAADAGGAA
ncbi:MAG TPA: ABC transporter ATP-binding protein [Phycisphaerales bacterium]|nr:ABC transporter ATP-binding protein [Phycisphaerales bacterium]